jgi:hypothetical protein
VKPSTSCHQTAAASQSETVKWICEKTLVFRHARPRSKGSWSLTIRTGKAQLVSEGLETLLLDEIVRARAVVYRTVRPDR